MKPITWGEAPIDQLPSTNPKTIEQQFAEGFLLLEQDENTGKVFIFENEPFDDVPHIPLSDAIWWHDKLHNVMGFPGTEDLKKHPAMTSLAAMSSGGPSLYRAIEQLIGDRLVERGDSFTKMEDDPHPPIPAAVQEAIDAFNKIKPQIILIHDLRLLPILQQLIEAIDSAFPPNPEEYADRGFRRGEYGHRERSWLYLLHLAMHTCRVLLSWYSKETLYLIRDVIKSGSDIPIRARLVSSDRHRAEVEFAAHWFNNVRVGSSWGTAPYKQTELLENDTVIRIATTIARDEDLPDLAREWQDRTDQEIINWLI